MPLFDWLFRTSRLTREPDRVFLTRKAKWFALGETAARMRQKGECGVVIAHFPATLTEVGERLADHGVPTEIQEQPIRPTDLAMRLSEDRGEQFLLLPAPVLLGEDEQAPDVAGLPGVTVLVPEMHPLPDREQDVEAFAGQLPSPRLMRFASLEDPVMKLFSGAGVEQILRQLGVKEDEEIQSQMLSRQIRRAQHKIAQQVETEVPARSVEEWMEENLPATVAVKRRP